MLSVLPIFNHTSAFDRLPVFRLFGGGLRVLLVLSMWHAPFPWLHRHEMTSPGVELASALARHVDEFHADIHQHGDSHTGWHVHLVLPSSMPPFSDCNGGDDDEPADSGHFGCSLKFAVARTSQSTESGTASAAYADRMPCAASCVVLTGVDRLIDGFVIWPHCSANFMTTYGASIAACNLLGVRVC